MPSSVAPGSSPSRLSRAQLGEIVALAGRGLSARQIRERIPELEPGAVRAAFLQAAELMRDEDLSLAGPDSVTALIERAQKSAAMSEVQAEALAVAETKAARQERNARRGPSRE